MSEQLTHIRTCAFWSKNGDPCSCCLNERIALQTEQTMHAAWRKRAEEAEAELAALKAVLPKGADHE